MESNKMKWNEWCQCLKYDLEYYHVDTEWRIINEKEIIHTEIIFWIFKTVREIELYRLCYKCSNIKIQGKNEFLLTDNKKLNQ